MLNEAVHHVHHDDRSTLLKLLDAIERLFVNLSHLGSTPRLDDARALDRLEDETCYQTFEVKEKV
jgi:hypothetical protein